MDYAEFFADRIAELKSEGRYRVFADLERQAGQFPRAKSYRDGKVTDITVWCSNDYLGMGQHEVVVTAMHEAIDKCGAGAGGTRNISGTNHYHVLLEQELADLHHTEAALIFGSVDGQHDGAQHSRQADARLRAAVRREEPQFDDRGIIHSRAEKKIFKHNDVADLDRLLGTYDRDRAKLVAFESVYSMDGDIAPIEEFSTWPPSTGR